jgi:hypothetical protein
MGPILPIDVLNVYQPKVNLVNQGCSLKGVTRLLRGHVPLSEPVELVIDERH